MPSVVLYSIAFLLCGAYGRKFNVTPIVLWHGIGDTCCDPGSIGGFKSFLESTIPGVYVLSIRIGNDVVDDKLNSYFMPAQEQVRSACKIIQNDPNLTDGYHAVGFSQGGLLMRALVQNCSSPPVFNLVTFGGPQQGVYGYPQCMPDKWACNLIRKTINWFAYYYFVQIVYVPFQYWHDPLNNELFSSSSIFLADVNNVNNVKQEYVDNLTRLKKFVMIRFLKDQVVIPYQSSWFGFYKDGQDKVVLPLNQTDLYKNDSLGLRKMDVERKLVFLDIDTPHMIFDYTWVKDNIIKYLT